MKIILQFWVIIRIRADRVSTKLSMSEYLETPCTASYFKTGIKTLEVSNSVGRLNAPLGRSFQYTLHKSILIKTYVLTSFNWSLLTYWLKLCRTMYFYSSSGIQHRTVSNCAFGEQTQQASNMEKVMSQLLPDLTLYGFSLSCTLNWIG